jgi:hypothetical protein
MKVFILGLAHGIQTVNGGCSALQRSDYRKFLQRLIAERPFEFIGEEQLPGQATIASDLAKALSIPWEPIDMSESEKEKLGFPRRGAGSRSIWEPMPALN